jgi:signal transduction histidine kinase
LDVPALLTETLELLRASLPANIRIERQLVAAGAVIADATQIHQIVMNLCTNAAHAMAPQGGTLTVTLAKAVIDGEHELIAKGVAPGAYLRLEVADTGQGMPAALQKRVFDPYFTTKARGKGTGMGLAVVHGIVQQLGGHIFLLPQPPPRRRRGLNTTARQLPHQPQHGHLLGFGLHVHRDGQSPPGRWVSSIRIKSW